MIKRSEYRSVKFETRTESIKGNSDKLFLRGYPILFNVETDGVWDWDYGQIKEVVAPTALNETDLSNVYLITGHNIEPDKVLGRNGVNMRMEVDETGLFFECELPDTQHAKDIYKLVESGIVDGMSFGFTTSDEVNPETLTRTINKIDELYEITITPFPAYKEASVIAKENKNAEEVVEQTENKKTTETSETTESDSVENREEIPVENATDDVVILDEDDQNKVDEIIQELEELLTDE